MIYVTIKTLGDGRIYFTPQGNGFMYVRDRAAADITSRRTGGKTEGFACLLTAEAHVREKNRYIPLPSAGVVGFVGAEGCKHIEPHRGHDTYSTWSYAS